MSNIVIWRFPKRGYPQIIQVIGPWLCIETTMVTTGDPPWQPRTPHGEIHIPSWNIVSFVIHTWRTRPEWRCGSSAIGRWHLLSIISPYFWCFKVKTHLNDGKIHMFGNQSTRVFAWIWMGIYHYIITPVYTHNIPIFEAIMVFMSNFTFWLFNSLPWKITMLLIGKPSISMGHLYHGYVK